MNNMQSDTPEKVDDYPEIPPELAKYADEIKATVRETVSFELKSATDSKPWQSKVGGIPYFPVGEEYPCNSEGEPLSFLMQVNFSEIPKLPGFPTEGIVEFYIDGTDDVMGLDFDDPTNQDGFRVLYFQSIESDESKLQLNVANGKSIYENLGPLDENFNMLMEFNLEKQFITPFDYRFNKYVSFGNNDNDDIVDEYGEAFGTMGHRIGGYPHFTQADPRGHFKNFQDYELLIQLDSDSGILWGDTGIGAFFIHPNDLKECNFSKVLYNWDCC